jgi:hypothetical protein
MGCPENGAGPTKQENILNSDCFWIKKFYICERSVIIEFTR